MQTVNLIPQGYANTQRSKRRLIISGAVMVAAVLAMFGLARLMDKRAEQKTLINNMLECDVRDLDRARAELASYGRELNDLAEQFSVVRRLDHNRRWASYLAHITRAADDNILLARALITPAKPKTDDSGARDTVQKPAPSAPGTPPADAGKDGPDQPKRLVLLLEGYALSNTDVTRFISALSDTGIFEQVTFRGSRMAQMNGVPLSRFELECPIRYEPRTRSAPTDDLALTAATGAER